MSLDVNVSTHDQPIRMIIVGMGLRGSWGVSAINATGQFEVVALVDEVPARTRLIMQELQLDRIPAFTTLDEALTRVDADAVAIFTPDGTHAELVIAALDAGKFVFVEKPLDISEPKMNAIVEADRRAGRRTFVGLNLRLAPVYAKVRQLISSGVVGRVLTLQADEFYDAGRTYFRRWNRLESMGGGLWITKACHDFDVLYWLADAEPTCVYASCSLDYYRPRADAADYCRDCALLPECPDRYDVYMPPQSLAWRVAAATEEATGRRPDLCLYNSDKDTFDHGVATMNFANGAIATYTLSVVAGFSNRRLRVGGTRATIDADLAAGSVTILGRDPAREQTLQVATETAMHGGADDRVFPTFADFVRGRAAPLVTPSEAAMSVRIGLAARRSCEQGRVIHIRFVGSNTD